MVRAQGNDSFFVKHRDHVYPSMSSCFFRVFEYNYLIGIRLVTLWEEICTARFFSSL